MMTRTIDLRSLCPRFAGAVLVLAALPLVTGCATTSSPNVDPAAVVAVGSTPRTIDHLEERALLLLIADRRTFEPVTVNAALDASTEVRRLAALTLGRLGDPRGGIVLQALLGDRDPTVRRTAVFALGELGESGDLGAPAASALLGVVNDDDREVGRLAVEALAKLGVTLSTVVERLIEGSAQELLPRLLPALFRFQSRAEPDTGVIRWALQGLEEEDPHLRAMAAYAAARTPIAESAPLLRDLLADGDPWIRGWAARALGEVGERTDLERLRPLLDDGEPGPLIYALRSARALIAAGKAAAPLDWLPRLLELLADERPGVRVTAIEASAAWLLDEDLGAELTRLASEGHPRERELALLALAEGEDPRAASALGPAARDDDPALRRAAARAAGLLGAAEVLDRLDTDRHGAVRAAALETRLAADPDDAVDRLTLALADRDPGVRASAFEYLVDHPVVPIESLTDGIVLSMRDRVLDARLAAADALAARAAAEPLERGTAIARLEDLLRDDVYLVRRRVTSLFADMGRDVPPLGSLRLAKDVEVYREIVRRTAAPRRVEIQTDRGTVTAELYCREAPQTCLNFLQLGTQGFYDGLAFHRVVPDFVVQAGDSRGDGRGGPGYTLRDEMNLRRYERGTLGMALSGPDTGGSQFFIALAPQPHLDGGYTVFGRVVSGLEVLDQILQGDRILSVIEVGP